MSVVYLIHSQVDARVRQDAQEVGHEPPVEDPEALAGVQLAAAVQDAGVLVGVAQRHPRLHHLHGVDDRLREGQKYHSFDDVWQKLVRVSIMPHPLSTTFLHANSPFVLSRAP